MDILSTISNLSIIQLLILGFVVIALQKSGIDVIGFIQKLLRKNGGDSVGSRMDKLEQHFNHETTEALGRIERKLDKLDDIAEGIVYLKAKTNGK